MRKKVSVFILCLLFVLNVCNIEISANSNGVSFPIITAPSAVLLDAKTGVIVYSKNMNDKYFPASITKIMTALLAIEKSENDYSQRVHFSYDAVHSPPYNSSSIAMDVDETLSLEDALYALMLRSANEVANAMGEHFSGDTEDFARLMTERAHELGAVNTNFTNPHGLHEESHYTTAYDMALIMKAAVSEPFFVELISTVYHKIPYTEKNSEPKHLNNTHKMIISSEPQYNENVVGGKTGFTNEAGNTLVTYAKQGETELIAVIMRDENSYKAYEDTGLLFEYGFSVFEQVKIFDASSFSEIITVTDEKEGGSFETGTVEVYAKNDVVMNLPSNLKAYDIQKSLDMPYQMSAPVEKDQVVGSLTLKYMDFELASVDLYAANQVIEAVPAMAEIQDNNEGEQKAKGTFVKVILGIVIVIGIAMVAYTMLEKRRRKISREKMRLRRERARKAGLEYSEQKQKNYKYKDPPDNR